MLRHLTFAVTVVMIMSLGACSTEETDPAAQRISDKEVLTVIDKDNPFLEEWNTPFGVPPFKRIQISDYEPAMAEGMARHNKEIAGIANNADAPSFANTLEAMDQSGHLLDKVSSVFYNLNSAHTNEDMQALAKAFAPRLSAHSDGILLNEALFKRIQSVYQQRDKLGLNEEQQTLLKKVHQDFVRGGANLDEAKKERLRQINERLSLLSVQFGENVLKENNQFEMIIDSEADLAGLPQRVIDTAAETAKERGHEGKWAFTLHKPSLIPFLQFSEKRKLRKTMYQGYTQRGDNNNELDNKALLTEMASLRVEKAQLLGFPSHAHYVLDKNMAKTPEQVYALLDQLWKPALIQAKAEVKAMQALINDEGKQFKLKPWDWWYYSEKLRKAKYDLDESALRPYFKLENVVQGVITVANKLWGIKLTERTDLPIYHEDVKTFEVKHSDGSHVGILFTDYFPRASKRGGAWMNSFRKQRRLQGENVTPVICNVGNFTKPTADNPSLLSLDETLTLFHEFGHALHGLLSDCTYDRLSGTAVARDFVQLPSQIMENWATEPEVLKIYARHYQTNKAMPDALIKKIQQSNTFNQGFITVEYLAASYLDMDWHTQTENAAQDALAFEDASMQRIGLIPEILPRYRSPYFQHIFAGGYSSGYYSYIWAQVLDADAFQAFKETDLFDQATADAFLQHVLSQGGKAEPMALYKRFRGAEPKVDALLQRKGFQ